MNTKQKGDIGESIVLTEFLKRGVTVSLPFGDNARYDMIAEFNGKLNRIQVKYSSEMTSNNSLICYGQSSLNHTTNKKLTDYVGEIDYFAYYLEPWDEAILVPIDIVGDKKQFTVRKDIPANNQRKGINFIWDYDFDKWIKN